jgi:RimJ/RimL family protein N-acetyltransferase
MTLFLQSTHLDLVAATLLHLDTELAGRDQLELLLGVTVPKSWPPGEYDLDAIRFFRERLIADGPGSVGWYGWYAICRRTALQPSTLVGAGGFLGPPDKSGSVELGFSVLPEYRGRNHATEMAAALVDHALSRRGVKRVVAHASVSNRSSVAVLIHCGFVAVAPGTKPGTLRFERDTSRRPPEPEDDAGAVSPDDDE